MISRPPFPFIPPVRASVIAGFAFAALLGSGSESRAVQGEKLPIEGSEFYRLSYAEDLVSVNDRCPVRKTRLGERMPPVLVNGQPIGFC